MRRRLTSPLAGLGAFVALLACGPVAAHAEKKEFTGVISKEWKVASNWSPAGVPKKTDEVIIEAGEVVVTGEDAEAESIKLDAGLSTGGVLNVKDHELKVSSSGTSVLEGFLVVQGTLTLGDPTTFPGSRNSGGLNVSGTVNVGASLTLSGSGEDSRFNEGGTVHVLEGASLKRTTSSGTLAFEPHLDNDGTVAVEKGTLELRSGDVGTTTGKYTISSGATLLVTNQSIQAPVIGGAGTLALAGNAKYTLGASDKLEVATLSTSGGAEVTLERDVSLANITSSGGIRKGSGGLTVTSSADFSDLQLQTGATTVAESVGSFTINKFLSVGAGATLNLDAPTSYPGSLDSNGINVLGTVNVVASLTLSGSNINSNINEAGTVHILEGASLKRMTSSGTLAFEPHLDNDGTVAVETGTLSLNTGLVQATGLTDVLAFATLDGNVKLDGGRLQGSGTLGGPVANVGGTVAPGSSPGTLTVVGEFTQEAGGTLQVDIAGTTPGTSYDQLLVGRAVLGGTLAIVTAAGFEPAPSDEFTIVEASEPRSGEFAALNGTKVGGESYSAVYPAHAVVLALTLSAPVNTAAPSIPTSAVTGTTIRCEAGSWTGAPALAFEWLRDGAATPGAAGATYTLAEGDAGHAITCRVTATNAGGSTSASSNVLVPSPKPPPPPASSGPPSIPASAVTGTTIRCEPGSWTGATTFSFQWLRDGRSIEGASAQTYTLLDGDAGHSIVCRVSATGAGGTTTASSNTLVPTRGAGSPSGPTPRPVPITQIASLPSPKACVSRRHFLIHLLHVKAGGIVTAVIKLNGRTVRALKGPALAVPVDLRGLPKGTFTVAIITTDAHGHRLIGKRRFHTCVRGKHPHG